MCLTYTLSLTKAIFSIKNSKKELGDRLVVGRKTLDLVAQVRILVPQPVTKDGPIV